MTEQLRESYLPVVRSAFEMSEDTCLVTPVGGGLESDVVRVRFAERTAGGRSVSRSAIVKRLEGFHRREAALYRAIAGAGLAPQVLARVDRDDATYLFLEPIRPVKRWPWRDLAEARRVMRQLAALHAAELVQEGEAAWEYESALAVSAAETLETLATASIPELRLGSFRTSAARVAANLAPARLRMMDALGMTFIHGDPHPGNVILREKSGQRSVVFLDWARSRFGSPLEDVASWLETLRHWEPAAARHHDSLLHEYLDALDRRPLDREVRAAYWIACASNALAGALRFHLLRSAETRGRQRSASIAQAREALRVIRRADAALR